MLTTEEKLYQLRCDLAAEIMYDKCEECEAGNLTAEQLVEIMTREVAQLASKHNYPLDTFSDDVLDVFNAIPDNPYSEYNYIEDIVDGKEKPTYN